MQYQVPQFIEVEDKIIGPLTLKQFFMLLAPGALAFILWFVLEFFLWVVVALMLGVFGAAAAFLKIGEQPFYRVFLALVGYTVKPRLYLWKQIPIKPAKPETTKKGSALLRLAGKINIFHN